jgi:mRNA interferase RelE/StbE
VSYQVIIPKTVQKEIDKLPKNVQESIIEGLLTLRENSRPPNSLKMKNSQGYRLRVGDYRVLYDINDKTQTVTLRRVGHRKEIYREK